MSSFQIHFTIASKKERRIKHMKNKLLLGCFMAIVSMTCPKEFSNFQGYITEDTHIICYNTNNDELEIDGEEENIPTPYDCDLPPQK